MSYHEPIMPGEVISLLCPEKGGVFVDCTLGGGGHSKKLFDLLPAGSTLFGIDRDNEAISEATKILHSENGKTFTAIHGNFFDLKSLLAEKGIEKVDGILMDLGVSSHQLDCAERGFSYMKEARLDMRMDSNAPLSAYEVVNEYSEEALTKILFEYGEERYARQIAKKLIKSREEAKIETTLRLSEIIKTAMPGKALREKQHYAKRTFQALRIEVNGELAGLDKALDNAVEILNSGAAIAVITFHSLEDRIVKQRFVRLANPCTCDPKAPICTCGKKPIVKIKTKKPLIASEEEQERNSRSKCAKLRAAEKI